MIMPVFTDQMLRTIHLPVFPPQRIVSVVPSQSELLADLGLGERVIGITKFCIHPPEWYREKKRVGGTKTLNLPAIEGLNPDLIIGNKEENDQAQIEYLAERFPVWMSDVKNLEDALAMIRAMGALCAADTAQALAQTIQQAFDGLQPLLTRPKTAYLIWRKPWMAAGQDTFIHAMLQRNGFDNVFGEKIRYPQTDALELASLNPKLVLLSSEPFPFAEKHIAEIREICPEATVLLVDGEYFSWYGSRLLGAPAYFAVIHKKCN